MNYPTPRTFGYRPPRIVEEPPSWLAMIAETHAKIADPKRAEAYLRGVWQSLEPVAQKDGQLALPLSKDPSELEERRQLVKALLQISAESAAA